MKNSYFCLPLIVLLLANLQVGRCISCYICNSDETIICLYPNIEGRRLRPVTCTNENLFGRKELQNVGQNILNVFTHPTTGNFKLELPANLSFNCLKQVRLVGDKELVIRGCGVAAVGKDETFCRVAESLDDTLDSCTLCNTDACNLAPHGTTISCKVLVFLATVLIAITNGPCFY